MLSFKLGMPTSEGDTEPPVGRLMKTLRWSRAVPRASARAGRRIPPSRPCGLCHGARRASTLSALEARGIQTATLDVTDAESIRRLQARLQHDGVTVALLINHAGYGAPGPLIELPTNELRLQFETNVFGLVALIQALLSDMVGRRFRANRQYQQRIGCVAHALRRRLLRHQGGGECALDSLRMELQPFGIEVITAQPGGGVFQFSATAAKRFHPSNASLYAAVTDRIAARLGASQARATPTEVFARKADAVLAPNPQAVVRIGHYSFLLPFLKRSLPTRALDRVLSRRFELDRLS